MFDVVDMLLAVDLVAATKRRNKRLSYLPEEPALTLCRLTRPEENKGK